MNETQVSEFLAALPPKPTAVTTPDAFRVGVIGLDHGHIGGMCAGLRAAGAGIALVYDRDTKKAEDFAAKYGARAAASAEEVLEDPDIRMIASAIVPWERGPLGIAAMRHGKDYFVDKTPFTQFEQIAEARRVCRETGRRYFCYFSERLHTESGILAGYLIETGCIGRVLSVEGFGPHRIGDPSSRPDWFWKKRESGGILCDIGSHQIEQFLFYTGAESARVDHARIANYAHPEHPEFEDYGDASLTADNGAVNHYRVDWFTTLGLSNWGDGRTLIVGTKGHIELRKFVNLATNGSAPNGEMVLWADEDGEHSVCAKGLVGAPFFGQMILDCLEGTERAMTQEHIFTAAELCVACEAQAQVVTGNGILPLYHPV
ncbi:MAG: Gfo/Idh/MocA family oxidoreductase [Clostridia bacterium]|nr:Gfo/Idh/MocA family oxidoreductase [Clostridia bacterium]